jgi:hypothetical protein
MLPAVEFDDELCVDADEICNVAPDRDLSPELPSMEQPVPQMPPEPTLSWRLLASELASEPRIVVCIHNLGPALTRP